MRTTTAVKWNDIADDIRDEKCVIILGDGAHKNVQGEYLRFLLKHQIVKENGDDILRRYDDGLYLFDSDIKKRSVVKTMRRFYAAQEPSAALQKLALVPFPLALTVTPDFLLHRAFEQQKLTFQPGAYTHSPSTDAYDINSSRPLLYHLLGNVENDESMVLTHLDWYDYFGIMMAQNGLPKDLQTTLGRASTLIFLGVPFDRWYFQILLRILNLDKNSSKIQTFAAQQVLLPQVRTLCWEQYKINFVQHDIDAFVDNLIGACEQNGVALRKGALQMTFSQQCTELLKNRKTEDALKLLEGFFKEKNDRERLADTTVQLARLSHLRIRANGGRLTAEQQTVEENNILPAVQDLIFHTQNRYAA